MPHAAKQPPADSQSALNTPRIAGLVEEHLRLSRPRMARLWDYYRNPLRPDNHQAEHRFSPRHLAQARGLPPRLTDSPSDKLPHEIVIENDIAWRLHAMVDFMFGQTLALHSLAPDPQRATQITDLLTAMFQANGGMGLLHDLALLGGIYGQIDILIDPTRLPTRQLDTPAAIGRRIPIDLIEPQRAIPLLSPNDYRRFDALLVHLHVPDPAMKSSTWLGRLRRRLTGHDTHSISHDHDRAHAITRRTDVWQPHRIRRYRHVEDQLILAHDQAHPLDRVPVVHIQNLPQPFFYEGMGEVEPLIPLQDELNTRLCDRANRVTFQAFKMYLGKGIEGFLDRPVGPGQMWATDNPEAQIHEFGGDNGSPSEQAHITEIREAMDKTSGISPIAAGLIKDKVGNLTSENALRIVLMGLINKTQKKRLTYTTGLQQLCELALELLDITGLFPNHPDERGVRFDWPRIAPTAGHARLDEARLKLELGVPRELILAELDSAPAHV